MAGWIGVDFDGTLAYYDDEAGIDSIGVPIPAMVERVKKLISSGETVKIFTARVSHDGTPADFGRAMRQRDLIQDWCEKYIGVRLEVTNVKDFGMIVLFDDRARQVVENTGIVVNDSAYL